MAEILAVRAAARWPEDMAPEWLAEIEAIRADETASPARRAWRALAFTGSLAVSPAVEAAGEQAVARAEAWARSLATSAGATLLAAALFNGVHATHHHGGLTLGLVTLAGAALLMVWLARRVETRTIVVGATLFAFLLAGNRIAVMPYMGWRDVLPATLVWTAGTALTVRATRRGHAKVVALIGGLLTLDLAVAAGGWHAAGGLHVGAATAPAWFPLSFAPGGTVTFGPSRASETLLGNSSAMAGPMLLCTVLVLTQALRTRQTRAAGQALRTRNPASRTTLEILLGVTAALAAQTACHLIPVTATHERLLANTTVFGFGFVTHTAGQIVVALIAGLLAAEMVARIPARA